VPGIGELNIGATYHIVTLWLSVGGTLLLFDPLRDHPRFQALPEEYEVE